MDKELKEALSGAKGAVLRYDVQADSETITMRPIHEIKDLANILPSCSQRQAIVSGVFSNRAVATHYCSKR